MKIVYRFDKYRFIGEHLSYDNPPKIYYRIYELVTASHYIYWPGIYSQLENAIVEIEKVLKIERSQ